MWMSVYNHHVQCSLLVRTPLGPISATVTQAIHGITTHKLAMKLLASFNFNASGFNLSDTSSSKCITLKTDLKNTILSLLKTTLKRVVDVIVQSLKSGSLVVDYTVVIAQTSESDKEDLAINMLLIMANKSNNIQLDGQNVNMLQRVVAGKQINSNDSVCMGKSCSQTEVCEVNQGLPFCR
ncbi:unnamed protein product [Lymnaea stagnalis]|uniref:Uncharacterized protein n=1 Tax=Lymnaea stagnalis TaxID=6523 RepID=A0AAV2INN8_LYMST